MRTEAKTQTNLQRGNTIGGKGTIKTQAGGHGPPRTKHVFSFHVAEKTAKISGTWKPIATGKKYTPLEGK